MKSKENITFDVVIEIPKGSKNKYEFDKEKQAIRLDRVLHTSMVYPTEYGYIPNTLAQDNDPADVLVITTHPTVPYCFIEVRPIGIFYMGDEKGPDEKILCVPICDPTWGKFMDIENPFEKEVLAHLKNEIEHFFRVYKDLENKKVIIPEKCWGGASEAIKIYKDYKESYAQLKK